MSQISPPMRILLAGAVVFLAAWMLFLKPGGDTETAAAPATPAATPAGAASDPDGPKAGTGIGRAVQSANGAAKTSDAANAAAGSETAPSTSRSTAPTAGKPQTSPATPSKPADPELAKLPTWVQDNIDKKVVAILFFNGRAADDRRTRAALEDSYRAHGRVVARAVPIGRISRYGAVARGVDVQQSPTLMIIDRDRHADALVGFSSRETIDQAIIDGLLATDNPANRVGYLQRMQAHCQAIGDSASLHPFTAATPKELRRNAAANLGVLTTAKRDLGRAKAPAAYKALGRKTRSYLASEIAVANRVKSTGVRGGQVDAIAVNRAVASNDKLQDRALLELNAVGVNACN